MREIIFRAYTKSHANAPKDDMYYGQYTKTGKKYKAWVIQSPTIKLWLEQNVLPENYRRMTKYGKQSTCESVFEIRLLRQEDLNLLRLSLGNLYNFVE